MPTLIFCSSLPTGQVHGKILSKGEKFSPFAARRIEGTFIHPVLGEFLKALVLSNPPIDKGKKCPQRSSKAEKRQKNTAPTVIADAV